MGWSHHQVERKHIVTLKASSERGKYANDTTPPISPVDYPERLSLRKRHSNKTLFFFT